MKEEYKTALIVGNGFDLNLGLKTSYNHFMDSASFPKSNSEFADHLQRIKKQKRWVDIEGELVRYSLSVEDHYERKSSFNFRNEYQCIKDGLKEYLKEITSSSFEFNSFEDKKAIHVLKEVMNSKDLSCIINFNYTLTLESLFETEFGKLDGKNTEMEESDLREDIVHVHGDIESDIVFGVEDSANVKENHVFIYKSHSPHLRVEKLPKILEDAETLIFFGYSLGKTDHSYFDDFFIEQTRHGSKAKKIIFYYYDQTAYDDLIWQLRTLTQKRLSKLKQYNDIQFKKV